MGQKLVIGEHVSLGAAPFYFPLKYLFKEENWEFVQGTPADIDRALERNEVDVGLASPLTVASAPQDFLILPDLGYAARRHVRDILLFSDMLLDDMDEMAVSLPENSPVAADLIRVILGRYLGYQNVFINGWGNAEAYVLAGDPALRERILARYSYVYDVGDLWRHYTRASMIYYLWVVRKEILHRKKSMLVLFHRLLKQGVDTACSDFDRLAGLVNGYEWIKKPMISQLWNRVEYHLQPPHFEGLLKFYEDCADLGIIEDVPDLEYYEDE